MDLDDLWMLYQQIRSGYKRLKKGQAGDVVEVPPITLDLGDFDAVLEAAEGGEGMQLRRK